LIGGCRVYAHCSWPLSGKWIGAFLRYDIATVERDRMLVAASHNSTQDCAPFLRWAGSKRRLLPVLKTFWTPKHKRYVEPFAGSACLFFAINPPKAILGDLNPELISTYIEVKYRIAAVLKELKKLPRWNKDEYIRLRSLDPTMLSPDVRAARFIYLNRFCFNGIYRTNLKGQFNVPYSGDRCGDVPQDEVFENCAKRLRRARFINKDFEHVLKHAEKGDLVYMDPPYAVRARRMFREYDPSTFTPEDITRLRGWMEKLNAAGINFVVSYAESDEADILKKNFSYETVAVRRNIAGFAAHRAMTNELLISNI
jgi:DNA adenine methylase